MNDTLTVAAAKAAAKLDSDEVLVMTANRSGHIFSLASDGQWVGTGRMDAADVIRDCERQGDGFVAYYLVNADGSHITL